MSGGRYCAYSLTSAAGVQHTASQRPGAHPRRAYNFGACGASPAPGSRTPKGIRISRYQNFADPPKSVRTETLFDFSVWSALTPGIMRMSDTSDSGNHLINSRPAYVNLLKILSLDTVKLQTEQAVERLVGLLKNYRDYLRALKTPAEPRPTLNSLCTGSPE